MGLGRSGRATESKGGPAAKSSNEDPHPARTDPDLWTGGRVGAQRGIIRHPTPPGTRLWAAWGRGGTESRARFAGARRGAIPTGARVPQTHSKRRRGPSGAQSWSARRCPRGDGPGRPRGRAPAPAKTQAPGQAPSLSASLAVPRAPPCPGCQGACAGSAARRDGLPTPGRPRLFRLTPPMVGRTRPLSGSAPPAGRDGYCGSKGKEVGTWEEGAHHSPWKGLTHSIHSLIHHPTLHRALGARPT